MFQHLFFSGEGVALLYRAQCAYLCVFISLTVVGKLVGAPRAFVSIICAHAEPTLRKSTAPRCGRKRESGGVCHLTFSPRTSHVAPPGFPKGAEHSHACWEHTCSGENAVAAYSGAVTKRRRHPTFTRLSLARLGHALISSLKDSYHAPHKNK